MPNETREIVGADENHKKGSCLGCLGNIIMAIAFIAGLATGAVYSAEILQRILG